MKTVLRILLVTLVVPLTARAQLAESYELQAEPSRGVASNVAIDIVSHKADTSVWFATGKGLNFTYDGGQTWYICDADNGLVSDNISALFSINNRLWVATNHHELFNGQLYLWSDCLSFSDDDGATWDQVDFGDIPYLMGVDRYVYDITGHVDTGFFNQGEDEKVTEWLFFAAFAGGLVASQDGGVSWRRIYYNASDSTQYNSGAAPSYRNLYFSCAVDTSHGDTLLLWTGTVDGVVQYVFITPRDKYYSRQVNCFSFCDTCSDTTGANTMFIGGSNGVTVGPITGGPYTTHFKKDVGGLPGQSVSALIDVGGRLLVGTVDKVSGFSEGLAVSTDMGDTYSKVLLDSVIGSDRVIRDFARMQDRIYMAAQSAGLFVSTDIGDTWERVFVDSIAVDSPVNKANVLHVLSDTLFVGTDDGLMKLYLDGSGSIDSMLHHSFAEEDSSSARIIRVRTQVFKDTLEQVDSTVIWTVHRPLTPAGDTIVGRYSDATDTWQALQVTALTCDVNVIGDTAYVVGEYGVRYTTTGGNPENSLPVGLADDTITCMEVVGDTILFGSSNGFAYSTNRGQTFRVVRANLDTLRADFSINHTYENSLNFDLLTYGLTGDWIPVLAVKYPDSGTAHIWATGRQVPGSGGWFGGRSLGKFNKPVIGNMVLDTVVVDPLTVDTLFDTVGWALRWQAVDTLNFAWNYEFVGDFTFSATDTGLLIDSGDATYASSIVPLDDDSLGALVDSGKTVLAVEAVDSFLWVGTEDGTVRITLSNFDMRLFAKVDSTTPPGEVYAYPVPFRPLEGQTIDFHFVVEEDGYVTIEVYDFAMNLVARPIDHVYYTTGVYPSGFSQGLTWDGRNGRGDIVAVGVYYFRVEYESGKASWGKLAVIP